MPRQPLPPTTIALGLLVGLVAMAALATLYCIDAPVLISLAGP